jgi:hypothetical protein
MRLRRRLRQLVVELVTRGVERIVAALQRVGLGPDRLVVAAADRRATDDLRFTPVVPDLVAPRACATYVDTSSDRSRRYATMHATWGDDRTGVAGVVTARGVDVSMPTGVHRWRRRILREGLLGTETLANPKYLAAFGAMFALGATELGEGVLLSLPRHHKF